MLIMVELSLEHVRVRVIHNYAILKWEAYFSWILVFDLVVLISNNVMRMFLMILDEVKVGQKLGFLLIMQGFNLPLIASMLLVYI